MKLFYEFIKQILVVLLILILFFWINRENKKNNEQDNVIKNLQEKVVIIEKSNSFSSVDNSYKQTELKLVEKYGKYGASVLQIGGEGSRFKQLSAYYLDEHGYLENPEEWISVSINTAGDMMWVDCSDGYRISKCLANGAEVKEIDEILGCYAPIKDQMKNNVEIECITEE